MGDEKTYHTGQRIIDHEILQVVAHHGMGSVYQVRDLISGRIEAMKTLKSEFEADVTFQDRFLREIRTLAFVRHTNICAFHKAMRVDGRLIMFTEWIDGMTLADLTKLGRIGREQILDLLRQTLLALAHCHAKRVIHRDIKPSNLLLGRDGLLKLIDFGIAKDFRQESVTMTDQRLGSDFYMSPEQLRDGVVDARSDLYSLGLVAYECMTGKRAFEARNISRLYDLKLHSVPITPTDLDPAADPHLSTIVMRAIATSPSERFQSAEEMYEAVLCLQSPHSNRLPKIPAELIETQLCFARKGRVASLVSAVLCLATILVSFPVGSALRSANGKKVRAPTLPTVCSSNTDVAAKERSPLAFGAVKSTTHERTQQRGQSKTLRLRRMRLQGKTSIVEAMERNPGLTLPAAPDIALPTQLPEDVVAFKTRQPPTPGVETIRAGKLRLAFYRSELQVLSGKEVVTLPKNTLLASCKSSACKITGVDVTSHIRRDFKIQNCPLCVAALQQLIHGSR